MGPKLGECDMALRLSAPILGEVGFSVAKLMAHEVLKKVGRRCRCFVTFTRLEVVS